MTKFWTVPRVIVGLMLALQLPGASAAPPAALDVARFTAGGNLLKPQGLENWVFVGASLGMGYNEAQFNPKAPGLFQVVQMEPTAWQCRPVTNASGATWRTARSRARSSSSTR